MEPAQLMELFRQVHPLAAYSQKELLKLIPWHNFKLRKVLTHELQTLQEKLPAEYDQANSRFYGCRWMAATAEPLPLDIATTGFSTHAIGQAILRSSPLVAAKFFLLENIKIEPNLLPTLVSGVAIWKPALCPHGVAIDS